MTLNFDIYKDDYSNSLVELFKKLYWRIFLYMLLISFITAAFTISNLPNEQTDWIKFSSIFIITLLLLNFAYFLRSYYYIQKNKKTVENNPLLIGKKTIYIEENGFIYGIENNKYNWESIKRIDDLPNYTYLVLHNNTSILINKKGLNNAEINNFIGIFSKKISVTPKQNSKNIYWLGLVGIFPNIGFIVGAVLMFLGFKRNDKKLKLIGLVGILFTPIFWFLFIQFVNKSDTFKSANIESTEHYLNEAVKDLEYYKSKNGFYPDSLGVLRKQNKFFNDSEIFGSVEVLGSGKASKFYYKKLENDYILKSCGQDLKLNTKDDIYPKFKQPKK